MSTGWLATGAVALGAAVGAIARWRIGVALASSGAPFPLGTLVVNLVGGLLIGVAMVLVPKSSNLHALLTVGLLGGFTTFSAFSAESLSLLEQGEWPTALAHTVAHVLGSLVCAGLGYMLARACVRG
jgi:fluoride exporter